MRGARCFRSRAAPSSSSLLGKRGSGAGCILVARKPARRSSRSPRTAACAAASAASTPARALGEDVAQNALGAAFRDPRFPAMSAAEWPQCKVEVSLLSTPKPLRFADEADLLAQIEAGEEGLIIEADGKRGTFLPQVWEDLREKRTFLAHLLKKAGLARRHAAHALQGLALPGGKVEGIDAKAIPAAGGTRCPTGACSATCARATASCTRASAALCFVRKMEGARWCSPPTAARRASASTRSRRSRSTISTRALDPLVRHRGLQPRVQVLPELGHLQVARDGPAAGRGHARNDRRRGDPPGLQVGGVHLQRPGDLRRVRDGHRRRLPRPGRADRGGHRGLHPCRAAPRVLRKDGRGERRPEGASPTSSTSGSAARSCSRCSTRSSTW